MPTSDYRPTLEQVGSLIRERTVNGYGVEVGAFSDVVGSDERTKTKPTATQAGTLLDKAVREVRVAVGPELPGEPDGWQADDPSAVEWSIRDSAAEVVSLYAAMLVELNYYGKQINTGGSTYPQLEKLYNTQRKALIEMVAEAGLGGGGESIGGDTGNAPSYGFPDSADLWGSRF